MGDKHALASPGGWVELRDPRELKAGDKKRIMRKIKNADQAIAAGLDVIDGLIAMLVVNWQLPDGVVLPLPSESIDSIDLLPIADYDRLCELVTPAQELLFPSAPNAATAGDPGSPTPPSGA